MIKGLFSRPKNEALVCMREEKPNNEMKGFVSENYEKKGFVWFGNKV